MGAGRLARVLVVAVGASLLALPPTAYSPDGAWIVHATNGIDDNADIFVMRADGTGNRPVTRTKLWDSAPDWGRRVPESPPSGPRSGVYLERRKPRERGAFADE